MSTVGVALGYRGQDGMPVIKADSNLVGESVTSSGTSAASTTAAMADQYWIITPLGNVWVAFGTAPVAAAGNEVLLAGGATYYFEATVGHKLAVLDAS